VGAEVGAEVGGAVGGSVGSGVIGAGAMGAGVIGAGVVGAGVTGASSAPIAEIMETKIKADNFMVYKFRDWNLKFYDSKLRVVSVVLLLDYPNFTCTQRHGSRKSVRGYLIHLKQDLDKNYIEIC
jgi:hypothetical protein